MPTLTIPPAEELPRVVGLDLSITATGVAHWDGTTHTIRTRSDDDARLTEIRDAITDAITGATLAVVEDLPTHAHGAGITGMVHGVVRLILIDHAIPYALVPPATLKRYATGRGNATKSDMRMALYQRTGADLRDDNQVDAAWLRYMGLDALGHPIVALPKQQRDAMNAKGITWPAVATA